MLMRSLLCFFIALTAADGVSSQCNPTLSMFSQLSSGQTDSSSIILAGELTSITFNLDFSGNGFSYPADMMVYIYAPNGECVVWGGWNINPTGGCTDIGTGAGNSWPGNWDTTVNGFYTYNLNTDPYNLDGSGTWSVIIQNAWTGSSTATYDLDLIFNGPCTGECDDPLACNFVADATLVVNELCEYAIDLYPSGYYDCEGNCLGDFNGNGVCDNQEIFGCIYAEAANFDSLATADDGSCISICEVLEPCNLDYDGDIDGFVSTPDLLGLLAEFGLSCD